MTETRPTVIGIVQLCADADVPANLSVCRDLVARASDQGAEVVFLPEAFAYIGSDRDMKQHLETLDNPGPILSCCLDLSRKHGIHLVAGGFPELAADGRAHNTCLHITPEGEIAAAYRKIHLFDVDLSDGTRMLESRSTSPGDKLVTSELPFGKLGLSVCYDVRFPTMFQDLVDRGAIALAIPAAFMRTTGQDHWHVLMRSRAIECQAYVIAAAQFGDHNHRGRKSFGHALVADPWGNIVSECTEYQNDVAIAQIDPSEVERIRSELPSLRNRGSWR
ncbi:MAG: carbon-nitrogen hydrolase family protein [Gammaproteobacteria bacterium]|nr:carbon-nitrogen hydrolase family protein [Gammaproteobacteria bacterium]